MKKIKVSKKDLKLLLIVLSLAFLWVSYFFVYSNNMKKTDSLNTEIDQLEVRFNDLQKKINDKDKIVNENETLEQKIKTVISSYGNGTSEEKSIIFVKSLEDNSGMVINAVSFKEPEVLFNGSNLVNENNNKPASDLTKAGNELSKANGDGEKAPTSQSQVDAQKLEGLKDYSGNKVTISLTFHSTYDGFKKCLEYITNYPEKCNVEEVSLSYDTETGNVSGTMSINMYHLSGKGITYQPPAIGNVNIGTKNIFGTIEIPIKDKKKEQPKQ